MKPRLLQLCSTHMTPEAFICPLLKRRRPHQGLPALPDSPCNPLVLTSSYSTDTRHRAQTSNSCSRGSTLLGGRLTIMTLASTIAAASPMVATVELVPLSRHEGDSRGPHQQRDVLSFRREGVGTVSTTARKRLPAILVVLSLLLLQTRTTTAADGADSSMDSLQRDSAIDSSRLPVPDSETDNLLPGYTMDVPPSDTSWDCSR